MVDSSVDTGQLFVGAYVVDDRAACGGFDGHADMARTRQDPERLGGVLAVDPEAAGDARRRERLIDDAVDELVGELVVVAVEERGDSVLHHQLVHGDAAPTRSLDVESPGAVGVATAPLEVVGSGCTAPDISGRSGVGRHVGLTAGDMVAEHEDELGVSLFEGGPQPVELLESECPVPLITLEWVVAALPGDGSVGLGHRVLEGIEDDERGRSPLERVVVLAESVTADGGKRVGVPRVEGTGYRGGEVPLAGLDVPDPERDGVIEVPAFLVLVIADAEEHRCRMGECTEDSPLLEVQVLDLAQVAEGVVDEGVAEVEVKIGLVECDVLDSVLVPQLGAGVGQVAQVGVGRDGEGERREGGASGLEGVLGSARPVCLAGNLVTHPVEVASVGLERVEDDLVRVPALGGALGSAGVVCPRAGAVVDDELHGGLGNQVERHRRVGRYTEQLGGGEGDRRCGMGGRGRDGDRKSRTE